MSSNSKGTTGKEILAILVIIAAGIAFFYFTGIWTPGE